MAYRNKKKRFVSSRKKKRAPEDLACFWQLVKDTSMTAPIRFVIQDENGNNTSVNITNGKMEVNGNEMFDATAMSFISRTVEDFERLFMAAAKPHDEENHLMGNIYIAKIADTSWMEKKPAVIHINDRGVKHTLEVTRIGSLPSFTLDGVKITEKEGRRYIWDHYDQFITGYKDTIKGMTKDPESPSEKKKKKKPDTLKSTKTEDGRIIVDIDGFLGESKKPRGQKSSNASLGEQLLKQKYRGYVDD